LDTSTTWASARDAAASNIATVYRDEGRHRLAFEWFRRATTMKDADAQVDVAKYFLSGAGVAKHRGRAVAALKRAIASKYITPFRREEAEQLLKTLSQAATST
jgi:TPR repeat protein